MTEKQLYRGIALAKAGKKSEARNVLGQVVRKNPQSVRGWLWLAGVVETKDQQRYCLEKVLQLNPEDEICRQVLARIRSENVPETADETVNKTKPVPAPTGTPVEKPEKQEPERVKPEVAIDSRYFVGHHCTPGVTPENMGALRRVFAGVFGPLEYEPYYTDEKTTLLLNVCQKIFLTRFAIFALSPENLAGYLELGIALGLNRPLIAIAKEKAALPAVLEGHHAIVYANYSDLEAKLSRLVDQGFPPPAGPVPDTCYFCGRICESMSTPPDENAYLVLNYSKLLWRDLMGSLAPHLAEYHLYPVYLTDRASGPRLCDMRRKVLSSQFALCHLGTLSNESSFLALGMAIGSRVPWILLAEKGHDSGPADLPLDLQGVDRIEYTTLADLPEPLTDRLGTFLGRIMADSVVKDDKTALLSLPFWVQLEDWIDRAAQPAQATEAIRGRIRVIQYRGPMRLSEHVVPERGLLFGRDPDCDVVLANQSVSSHHFRILKGRTGKCFVKDLHSKNGTFFNGTRLSPGERVELRPNDTIRIPGTRFLIWDDRPLPREEPSQTFGGTGLLPPIARIELPDVSPPAYLSTWDHSVVLTVLLPDGHHRATFEVQAYYPMGRILAQTVNLLDLPRGRYHFKIENKLIDDDETPLSIRVQREDILIIVPE